MKTLGYLIQKEFIQIFRNKALLPLMTILPIIQLIVLSSAATQEIKHVKIVVIDQDQSASSRLLLRKIVASPEFSLVDATLNRRQAANYMQANETDIILEIPIDFEREYLRGESPRLQMLVNAINGQQATVGAGYLNSIIATFNEELLTQTSLPSNSKPVNIGVASRNWYNPELSYPDFMVPGILAEITALLTIILSAMNVVREREIGTIEQINVTPIKKWQFILGKLIPFLGIGIFLLIVGLTVGKLVFDIPLRGSLGLLFGYTVITLIAVLGFGLLISNFANTQQQAIFVAFFFVLIFILMSGLFTPIESMPPWAQYATIPNPMAHFIAVSRKILMKGSGLEDIQLELMYISLLALFFNTAAIWSYQKQA